MSRTTTRAALSAGTALVAAAALAPSAFAASPTEIKVVGSTLWVTAGAGSANVIDIKDEPGSPNVFRVKDTGAGVTLTTGGGTSTVVVSPQERVVYPSATIKSVRAYAGDLNDTVTLTNLSLPAHVFGRAGNDILTGGSGRTTFSGGGGSDQIFGGSNDDTLIGGSGADALYGNGGDDILWAVDGTADTAVQGGSGYDVASIDSDPTDASNEETIVGE